MTPPRPKLTPKQRAWRTLSRRAVKIALAAAVLAGLAAADHWGAFGRKREPDYDKYNGKVCRVVHVVDGDTLDVDVPDVKYPHTRVRLWGVDTPETVKPNTPPQHFGPEAGRFTKNAAFDRTVRLELEPRDTRDKYERLLAYVYLSDGRMLNRVLLEEGFAYADPRFDHSHKKEFHRLMESARRAGRGLWKDITEGDLPYYLRERVKLQTHGEGVSRSGDASVPPAK